MISLKNKCLSFKFISRSISHNSQNYCDQETSLLLLLFEQIRLLLVSVATCAEEAEAVAVPLELAMQQMAMLAAVGWRGGNFEEGD